VARLAHQMAMESEQVTADVIESNEFPRYSAQYAVQAVPKTVVNERHDFLGAVPEARFLQEIARAFPGGEADDDEPLDKAGPH
jgi:hypothetical protein